MTSKTEEVQSGFGERQIFSPLPKPHLDSDGVRFGLELGVGWKPVEHEGKLLLLAPAEYSFDDLKPLALEIEKLNTSKELGG